uniref:Rho-GAP domain-containing protein n=1 Tax=Gouania willdenowi TaxID=441366 RepID=A0A8C5E9P8_GOUWI
VDGIYRLSGVTSNIQRLSRQEFCSEACPDLTKEVYLQDIHCVGSLCKLYFRELPNPLLTYELYSKFTEAVLVQGDHERLLHIQKVIKELPVPHFRTLEYLTKHLAYLATFSSQTNMHTRNLALVWAPNLLRSKDIETSSGNGDMAFQEVRIQQSVVEFILNHTEQIFNGDSADNQFHFYAQSVPMKLMSLEEAQARSLSPNHPVHRERQRENSLPNTSTATLYHTKDLDSKCFHLKNVFCRSGESCQGNQRNGSLSLIWEKKASLRPSRSMESLCSLPTDDDRTVNKGPSSGCSSIFTPDVKSRTLGSDSLFDLGEHEQNWEIKSIKPGGATCAWSSGINQTGAPGDSAPPRKSLPEQLKVFKGDDDGGYKPTSPKNRRMLYSGSSHNSSSRPSFPGSFFPLESSPRHQRRAVNISEPFAVSVPLRVSAVISSNSTPCGALAKDKAATLRPPKESAEQGSTFPQTEAKKQETSLEPKIPHEVPKDEALRSRIAELESIQRLSVCLEEKRNTLELPKLEEDEGCGRNSEELDLVEDWEDLNSTKQWVTSPLHSPDVEQMFNHFSNLGLQGDATSSLDVKRQNSSESVAKAEPQWIHQASGKIGSTKASPFSLNLDTSHRCIRDISNQQSRRREKTACPEAGNNGLHSDLELFLSDCQAPLRRNSAPVSVASVRTAFMIKTCQAKAVPVVPPKVQYSQIPHLTAKEPETERPKMIAEKSNSASPPSVSKLKEELENKEPKHQKHLSPEKLKSNTTSDVPVVTRRHAPSLEVFVDCPRANRTNVLQRPSFRNRQRPQSLILFSPPFPIMDYPTSNDDGKFLSSIKGLDDSTTGNVFSRETVEGVALQNKMTIPKSGQRLETSTSCFYQPQRRSMIFDSRSQRQIE